LGHKMKRIRFVKEGSMDCYLVKVAARMGDDLWIITDTVCNVGPGPSTFSTALRFLTKENGWRLVVDEVEYQWKVPDAVAWYIEQHGLGDHAVTEQEVS